MTFNYVNISARTTPSELKHFADVIADDSRLRGVKHEEGTLLYVKKAPSNLAEWLKDLWSRISGKAGDERAAARNAIRKAMDRAFEDPTQFDKARTEALKLATSRLMDSVRSRSMIGRELKEITGLLMAGTNAAPVGSALRSVPQYGEIVNVSAGLLKHLSPDASVTEQNAISLKMARSCAALLAPFLQTAEGTEWASRLALSSGAGFIHDLRHAKNPAEALVTGPLHDRVISNALGYLLERIVPAKETADGTLTFQGKVYAPESRFNRDHSAETMTYRNVDDAGDVVVVRRHWPVCSSIEANDEKIQLMREAHRLFDEARGIRNMTMRPLGAVRMQDGTTGLMLSPRDGVPARELVAPNRRSRRTREIDPAHLRIARETARHLLRSRQRDRLINLHFNLDNIWVGEGGRVTLNNPGWEQRVVATNVSELPLSDSSQMVLVPGQHPSHLPPEFYRAMDTMEPGALMRELLRESHGAAAGLREQLAELLGSRQSLLSSCFPHARESMQVATRASSGRDSNGLIDLDAMQSWMFGCMVFELVYGRRIVESDDVNVVRRELGNIALDGPDFLVTLRQRDSDQSMVLNVGSLLRGLLHPDPRQRMSISQAFNHAVFSGLAMDVDSREQTVAALEARPTPAALEWPELMQPRASARVGPSPVQDHEASETPVVQGRKSSGSRRIDPASGYPKKKKTSLFASVKERLSSRLESLGVTKATKVENTARNLNHAA